MSCASSMVMPTGESSITGSRCGCRPRCVCKENGYDAQECDRQLPKATCDVRTTHGCEERRATCAQVNGAGSCERGGAWATPVISWNCLRKSGVISTSNWRWPKACVAD